ncbi:hypothetical protein HYALB_00013204 [Hymenoscyphus albidus]|uniref:NB-ARC domain-containing protein n=1 Tax=Hymenoscyphus albidus TaxID=595503 RepID=A0A9N9LP57_9HELO|nr:hypothetical protein HYALB_00013204 [Hymenoscyphus albidus]
MEVELIGDFRSALSTLMSEYQDERSAKAILLMYRMLEHYKTFAESFISMMENPVEISMMWGLLSLLALNTTNPANTGEITPIIRITRWLERIGQKLKASNDCKGIITDFSKVKGDTVKVDREIIVLWLNVIMAIRNGGFWDKVSFSENAWESLTTIYNKAYQNIDEAVMRIERVAKIAEKQARDIQNMQVMQHLISLGRPRPDRATLPCNNLPVAENRRFFGCQDMLQQLEEHLLPSDTNSHFSSIALYGLRGIGKTQIALAYAYQKLDELDAVLWIPSEDYFSIQQGFSRVAVDYLKLLNAHSQSYQENMILVLNWLHTTSARWLLIFDNVNTHNALDDCWPVSTHGAVLVTTQDVLVATLPFDIGLEVNELGVDDGAEFLLHMTPNRKRSEGELNAAHQVTTLLHGLPLPISQMAAFINAQNSSISEFHNLYLKYEQRLHKQRKSG